MSVLSFKVLNLQFTYIHSEETARCNVCGNSVPCQLFVFEKETSMRFLHIILFLKDSILVEDRYEETDTG